MADRRLITDRYLRALPPAPRGQRVEVFDPRLPGFGIRISDTVDAGTTRQGRAHQLHPVHPERAASVVAQAVAQTAVDLPGSTPKSGLSS
jgi:hypothetical protein